MSTGACGGASGGDGSVNSQQEQTSGESDSSKPHSSKRTKGKSKVWERVAWFTRRSKSKDVGVSDEAITVAATGNLDQLAPGAWSMEVSPPSSANSCSLASHVFWAGSSSSSEIELYENHDARLKKSKLYPNSEIIEHNCLKPSTARALFLQLEAVSQRSGLKPPKYSFQKQKRRRYHKSDELHGEDTEEPIARALSVPGGMEDIALRDGSCHCESCCNCSIAERLQGSCPRYSFPRKSTSTTSLDMTLSHHRSLGELPIFKTSSKIDTDNHSSKTCLKELNENPHDVTSAKDKSVPEFDSVNQYKSNSLPAYYSHAFHKKCLHCDKPTRVSHLPSSESQHGELCESAMLSLPYIQGSIFCQCKQYPHRAHGSRTALPHRVDEMVDGSEGMMEQVAINPQGFKCKTDMISKWFDRFDDIQKNALLKQLLSQCELPQLHLLSLEMEPRLHKGCPPNCCDLLGWLPPTVSLYIFSFLDPASLCRASAVCWRWHDLISEPSLWRKFCSHLKWRLSVASEQKQLIQHVMPNGCIDWKRVFGERFKLCNNWLKGRCNVRTFEGHTQGISCVQFDDTRIVSGSSDKTIKVWNIRTNSPWLVQTLTGHSGTVRCLHLDGNRLVSGSTDRTIKVWDLSTQQSWSSIACKVTMVGHLDTVRCIQVDDEKVISGSYDKSLKVWNIRSGICTMTLRGHEAGVLCVQFDDSKIISGSCDKTIKMWNFEGHCVMTLHGHHDAVTCLQFNDNQIISGSLDCNLKFWDLKTGDCQKTIDWKASEGHTGVVRCLQADSWRVVSASDDRTLKVWSLETGRRLATLRNHTDGVTCLQFNDTIIVSGSYDKTVKLWDFGCC